MSDTDYENIRRAIEAGAAHQRGDKKTPDLLIKVGIFSRGKFRRFLKRLEKDFDVVWDEPFLDPWKIYATPFACRVITEWIKANNPDNHLP